MNDTSCSLLDCASDVEREFTITDYEGRLPRWCAGCGDLSTLTAVQRLLTSEQLKPENTVFVSGIGCSSRFPHYVKTYGFHGLHGRALPVATGIKLHRPELNVFVVMGDGDCCSIGAAHWIHATRYNLNMTALMLDNNIYALTKNQSSPTSQKGLTSNTMPYGTVLDALDPLTATLGVTNVSFVAQTAEWVPAHLYATLQAAYRHQGFSFVRILQRCPVFTPEVFEQAVKEPDRMELLVHEDGINVPQLDTIYKNRRTHDPSDIHMARQLAEPSDRLRLGIFYRNESRPRYEETLHVPYRSVSERITLLNQELDRHAV
jgi:2-oxoglutarate/2-oxoacid ferredoxin oxidoreductase subunit beta